MSQRLERMKRPPAQGTRTVEGVRLTRVGKLSWRTPNGHVIRRAEVEGTEWWIYAPGARGVQASAGSLASAVRHVKAWTLGTCIARALRTDPATAKAIRAAVSGEPSPACQASRGDGECYWKGCPQIRDGEPDRTGRHCPLDRDPEEF